MSVEDTRAAVGEPTPDDAMLITRVYYTTKNAVTPVRSGPSLNHTARPSLPRGSAVSIACQCEGQRVSGPYGSSTIWDRIGPGRYVPDSYVFTDSDEYVAPKC